jgi:hypothetical protein
MFCGFLAKSLQHLSKFLTKRHYLKISSHSLGDLKGFLQDGTRRVSVPYPFFASTAHFLFLTPIRSTANLLGFTSNALGGATSNMDLMQPGNPRLVILGMCLQFYFSNINQLLKLEFSSKKSGKYLNY